MAEPRTHGVVWSDVVRRIEAGEPVAEVRHEERLHPQWGPLGPLATREAGMPGMDLGEDPPPPVPARAYELEPAPPHRRGWLLRAIEGIFG